jgi:hypothetical protein
MECQKVSQCDIGRISGADFSGKRRSLASALDIKGMIIVLPLLAAAVVKARRLRDGNLVKHATLVD